MKGKVFTLACSIDFNVLSKAKIYKLWTCVLATFNLWELWLHIVERLVWRHTQKHISLYSHLLQAAAHGKAIHSLIPTRSHTYNYWTFKGSERSPSTQFGSWLSSETCFSNGTQQLHRVCLSRINDGGPFPRPRSFSLDHSEAVKAYLGSRHSFIQNILINK